MRKDWRYAHRLGSRAEAAAALALVDAGYLILRKNYRCPAGEWDLIAYREEVLVFAEVRARGSGAWVTGAASIDGKKQKRLLRAARWFCAQEMGSVGHPVAEIRYDAFVGRQEGALVHIKGWKMGG